ncbi:MAG: hypothetical protein ABDH18_05245 [Aquificaceae bacterium]
MSIRVEGIIDLPYFDLRDIHTLQELLMFLKENELCKELKDYRVFVEGGILKLEHSKRSWSYIEISPEGRLVWDEHYRETVEEKDSILGAIREYYPMFKKALEIHLQVGGTIRYDRERELIILEVEE